MNTTATPTKLRNGDWGARTTDTPGATKGDLRILTVTTKAGKSWNKLHTCIWANGEGVALWATVSERQGGNGGGITNDEGEDWRTYRGHGSGPKHDTSTFRSACRDHHFDYVDMGRKCPGCGSYN